MNINRDVYEQIIRHARVEAPLECCGYLAGVDGENTKAYPMENIDKSAIHYSFEPEEQFRTVKAVRKLGLKVLAVYHSHPESPARPSAEDISLAYDPNMSYVIISLTTVEPVAKSFRIKNGQVQEEELKIL